MKAGEALGAIATLPFADLATIAGDGPVLVLAPHPDDESLGAGGLIAQAAAAGRSVHIAILTDGTKSHPGSRRYPPARLRAVREAEAEKAAATLGVPGANLLFLGLPDAAAPRWGAGLRDAGDRLATAMQARGIATLAASWQHDPHCDHLAAHRVARRACRLTGARQLAYPVWGWTLPPERALPGARLRGWRLDVAGQLPAKRRAIACHRSQLGQVIDDDPGGFTIPPHLLALHDRPWEAYLQLPPAPSRSLRRRASQDPC